MSLHTWFRLYVYVVIARRCCTALWTRSWTTVSPNAPPFTSIYTFQACRGMPWEHAQRYQETHTHGGSETGDGLVFLPDCDAQPGVDASYALQWIAAAAWLAILPALLLVAVPLLAQWGTVSALVISLIRLPRALA